MAYAEQSPRMGGPINEHASALAHEWRRLTRVATGVALLTAPAFFLLYLASNGGSNPWDAATDWAADTSWVVVQPWAQPPGGSGN